MTRQPSSTELPERDLVLLSAYIDGELTEAERTALEQRLAHESRLRRELEELQATRDLLREQPWLTPPRSFTLTPEMAGVRQRRFNLVNWWQPFGGLVALVLVILFGWQILRSGIQDSSATVAVMQTEPASEPAMAMSSAETSRPGANLKDEATTREADSTEHEPMTMTVQMTPESGIPAVRPPLAGGGGNAGLPPEAEEQRPATATPPSPPPLPVVIGLAVLLLIAAGVWLIKRNAE
ncbi:anti-sigma factor [Chloroflexus sp.]|uniref:anti-sigma factor n=1 Tax=Chloroflexus sp. TaxID=1904827 RepID=UPI003C790120